MYPAVAARRRCRVPEFILESFRLGNTSEITAFDGDPGVLMVFGGRLVDFSQSCVKTVALAYTERESWHDPACPDVPVLVFSAWCPRTALIHSPSNGHCLFMVPAQAACAFPQQPLPAEVFPEASREVWSCADGVRGAKRGALFPVPASPLVLIPGIWGKIILCG